LATLIACDRKWKINERTSILSEHSGCDHAADHGQDGALAQGTPEQQEPCKPDVFRLCGNFIPDVDRIVACLETNEPNLSPHVTRYFSGP
jgi:hypothetical protein